MAAASGGSSKSKVHVFNFKYNSDESLDKIKSFVSDEIIKYTISNAGNTSKVDETVKKSGNVFSSHKLLDLTENIVSASVNKEFICFLKPNGSCSRAVFKSGNNNTFKKSKSNVTAPELSNEQKDDPKLFDIPTATSEMEVDVSPAEEAVSSNPLLQGVNLPAALGQFPPPTISLSSSPSARRVHQENQHQRELVQARANLSSELSQADQHQRELAYLRTSLNLQQPDDAESQLLQLSLPMNLRQNSIRFLERPPSMSFNRNRRNEIRIRRRLAERNYIPFPPSIFYGNEERPGERSLHVISDCTGGTMPVVIDNNQFEFEIAELSQNSASDTATDEQDFFNSSNTPEFSNINVQLMQELNVPSSSGLNTIFSNQIPSITNSQLGISEVDLSQDESSQSGSQFEDMCSIEESCWEEKIKCKSIHSMESAFVLLDFDGVVWLWYNHRDKPIKINDEWNGKSDQVELIGCSSYRVTFYLKSKRLVTFHDSSFKDVNRGSWPKLITNLSHGAVSFNILQNEEVIDVQCSLFYTAVQTLSGKVFWWGLAPSCERYRQKTPQKNTKSTNEDLEIGDHVILGKSNKHENGALVFNHTIMKYGIVTSFKIKDKGSMSHALQMNSNSKRQVRIVGLSDDDSEELVEWDVKDFIFLEEETEITGEIISFDGVYAIVQHNEPTLSDSDKLKVYFKASLEKINTDTGIGQSRYHKYLSTTPVQIFSDNKYTISAVSCSEAGITLLFNRESDNQAFLTIPNTENLIPTMYTCGKPEMSSKTKGSPFSSTVEYESVCSANSNLSLKHLRKKKTLKQVSCHENLLDIKNSNFVVPLSQAKSIEELDGLIEKQETVKIERSMSTPVHGFTSLKRKHPGSCVLERPKDIHKPQLFSLLGGCTGTVNLLLDNKNCFYPVRYDCCLREPALFEMPPINSFSIHEQSSTSKTKVLTIVAVIQENILMNTIKKGVKAELQSVLSDSSKKMKMPDEPSSSKKEVDIDEMLLEYCSGNQNVMHIAASNILRTKPSPSHVHGNIMDVRSDEENFALKELLDNPLIWSKVRELLCERDSHGCTPFMRAITTQNLRGAYLILEAVKGNHKHQEKKAMPMDEELFNKAICAPTLAGLTPVHYLIHSSSKKTFHHQWANTLKVSNLPQNYSARLLLKLFKSHYPSAYRAIMPVPKPHWPQMSVRDKFKQVKKQPKQEKTTTTRKKEPPVYFQSAGSSSRRALNHAEAIKATTKEGLIMFGDAGEMFQALVEMNGFALLSKTAHPSGALLSVVQHMLQVQQYQEVSFEKEEKPATVTPLPSSLPLIDLRRRLENIASAHMSSGPSPSTSSKPPADSTPGDSNTDSTISNREETISKCFDDIMVHLLLTSLISSNPNVALVSNDQGESALMYFMKTYPRYSPSSLHKLFLNWRPCNAASCKYNRHVGRLSITPQKLVESVSQSTSPENEPPVCKKKTTAGRSLSNPILNRRGLQSRTRSLMINVEDQSSSSDMLGSPATPSIKILENLKYAPIELSTNTGLTPKVTTPARKGTNNPLFPPAMDITAAPKVSTDSCTCHLNKARLLWNTTFEATHFLLSKDWPSLISTILCNWKNREKNIIPCEKLDSFTASLLLNPYSVILEVFVKALIQEFLSSPISKNPELLCCLFQRNPTDEFVGKTFNALVPWLTVQRFVRSIVRQLSLFLSKNTMSETNLKFKIGRYANKNHSKKETRMKENLSFCLTAFSWISVLEILRAAVAMLQPIRKGTVKAQPQGIIHNGPISCMGMSNTSLRMQATSSGTTSISRPIVIRNASHMSPSQTPLTPSLNMIPPQQQSDDSQASSSTTVDHQEPSTSSSDHDALLSDSFPTLAEETDLNEVDWARLQGPTPAINWAVDGHIRVRNETTNRLLPPPPGLWHISQQSQVSQQMMQLPSTQAGFLYLARMFCRLVKEAADISVALKKRNTQETAGVFILKPMELGEDVEDALRKEAEELMETSWKWMVDVLDSLESQLEAGTHFDTKHYVLRLKKSNREEEISGLGRPNTTHMYGSTPEEYMMYLLKQDAGEAQHSLPILDLFSYEHLTYVMDAFHYSKKSRLFERSSEEKEEEQEEKACTEEGRFFRSTYPLLKGGQLEGFQGYVDKVKHTANNPTVWLDKNNQNQNKRESSDCSLNEWSRVVEAFTSLFLTAGPGYERESFLAAKAGSSGRISRFQRSLATVRGGSNRMDISNHRDNPSLLINVSRDTLLEDCLQTFMQNLDSHPYGSLRVRFEGEKGTGPGVNRGLFPAFANTLKKGAKYKDWPVEFFEQCGNLPSQQGIFTPKSGSKKCVQPSSVYFVDNMTKERRNAMFVGIGRFLGISMWFNQPIPFILSRHVLLFILGRQEEITFDELAYFNTSLYDSFSHMLKEAFHPNYDEKTFIDTYCCYFQIVIDGETADLIFDGKNTPVTRENIMKYLRLYTTHLLVTCRLNELNGLRDGALQMIPKDLLDTLEPEDLQLVLSGGVDDVTYASLRSIITFSNSRACTQEALDRYKAWFWQIVHQMTPGERQKLLYFSTGSSVLPALDNRVGANEELRITIDIADTVNSAALPMASTCNQRISTPLYPSKQILKQKLLQAIQCESYGLG